jgi:hypothetical protein
MHMHNSVQLCLDLTSWPFWYNRPLYLQLPSPGIGEATTSGRLFRSLPLIKFSVSIGDLLAPVVSPSCTLPVDETDGVELVGGSDSNTSFGVDVSEGESISLRSAGDWLGATGPPSGASTRPAALPKSADISCSRSLFKLKPSTLAAVGPVSSFVDLAMSRSGTGSLATSSSDLAEIGLNGIVVCRVVMTDTSGTTFVGSPVTKVSAGPEVDLDVLAMASSVVEPLANVVVDGNDVAAASLTLLLLDSFVESIRVKFCWGLSDVEPTIASADLA